MTVRDGRCESGFVPVAVGDGPVLRLGFAHDKPSRAVMCRRIHGGIRTFLLYFFWGFGDMTRQAIKNEFFSVELHALESAYVEKALG